MVTWDAVRDAEVPAAEQERAASRTVTVHALQVEAGAVGAAK
jgi:hypothetical protein